MSFRFSVRLGGNVNNGANYGLLYFNANNAPSNANWNYGGGLSLYASQRAGGGASTSASDIPSLQGDSLRTRKLARVFSGVGRPTEIHPTGTA